MIKTYCDICKQEKPVVKRKLPVSFENLRWEFDVLDICERCEHIISGIGYSAQLDWMTKQIEEREEGADEPNEGIEDSDSEIEEDEV